MSFKVKRWGSLGQIALTDYYPGAVQAPGGDYSTWLFSFGGRMLFLAYAGSTPLFFTYDPAGASWSGPHASTGLQDVAWSWHSYTYGDTAMYIPWGKKYIVGYGLSTSNWTGSPIFVTFDSDFNLSAWSPPPPPTGPDVYNPRTTYFAGIGCDPSGEPARLASVEWRDYEMGPAHIRIYRYGPGGTTIVREGDPGDIAWDADPVDGQRYYAGVPLGSYVTWPVDSGCSDARVEDFRNLFPAPPLAGSECAPAAPLGDTPSFVHLDDTAWGIVSDRTSGVAVERWAPVSSDPVSTDVPPWTGTWDYRRQRDGLGFAVDQGDVDGIDHSVTLPVEGDVSYNAGLGWYLGAANNGKAGTTTTIYVLDPHQPAGMTPRTPQLGTTAIGWIGECAIRPNLRVENVLPADRANPQGLGGSTVERKNGKYIMTNAAIVKRTGNTLANSASPLSVDVSSYPVTSPDWLWPGSEDGRVEQSGWTSFAEGPDDTMLWGGMPDYMWGMYWIVEGVGWVPRWGGLGVLHNENLEVAPGGATHKLESSSGVSATATTMQPMPANYENAPDQLAGYPDFPGGPIVTFFQNCARQSQMPFWEAVVWRVDGSSWSKIVDFRDVGPPGLGETNWTVWSIAPIYACKDLPAGGFLVGATLYFDPWDEGAWEDIPGARAATFMATGKGYVPSVKGWRGPLEVDNEPQLYACEPYSGGRSLYGPDALLVYDHMGTFVTHLNTSTVYPPDGRQILVTRGSSPKVIFKIYKEGTYSDFAEGWGAYHRVEEDAEVSTPLYVCYDLFATSEYGSIKPGMGKFRGFLDMRGLGASGTPTWRWTMPATVNGYYALTHPQEEWGGAGRCQIRIGLGGRTITLLGSQSPSSRQGTKGVGQRA
ncbi:MAG: hypothetical protein ACYC6T_07945 [Thermoleophilia bacterium]